MDSLDILGQTGKPESSSNVGVLVSGVRQNDNYK